MSTATLPPQELAELAERLGGIAVERIALDPAPGTATEEDCLRLGKSRGALLELIDGTLVEKAMGLEESFLAMLLGSKLVAYCHEHDIGLVGGEGGLARMSRGNVRVPDLAVYPWSMFPSRSRPRERIASLCPKLGVEILSESNRPGEIALKLKEYFASGMTLAWVIDPEARTARVHTSAAKFTTLDDAGTLDGGLVVPGFLCPLGPLFDAADRRSPRSQP